MNQILSFLESNQANFLTDLAALVNLDCGTANKAGVDQVGQWLNRRCRAWGWHVDHFPIAPYGDCWLARLHGQGSGRLLLIGHMDTVYPDGTAAARPLRFEGNRIFGPGVCDMKGGLLTGLYAVRALQTIGFANFAELLFFFNSEEELGSPVSRSLYGPLARQVDAALVLESARMNGDIVSARKGAAFYQVRVRGQSAHAGVEPEKGANAALELAHQLITIQRLNGIAPGVTVNVGRLNGGTAHNVIPAEAWAEIDGRAIDLAGMDALTRAMSAFNGQTTIPGTQVEISGGFSFPPMTKTPASAFLVKLALAAAGEIGVTTQDTLTGGASDANLLAALGVPVLDGLGPVGGLDHSPAEYIELDSLIPRAVLLALLIQRVLAQRQHLAELRLPEKI